MNSFEYGWQGSDGVSFFGQGWAPEKPKAVVCLVHGLGEHSGRYAHVGKVLSDAGYALLAFDLRGFGRSGGRRGHAPSIGALDQDIDRLWEEAGSRYPGLPRFVYGHSLGGVLVLGYALRRRPAAAGIISTAPGLSTAIELQKGKVAIAKILGSILPTLTLRSGLDPNTICRDPEVVRRYVADPLCHDKMTTGFGKVILEANAWTKEHAGDFALPLLLMHGTEDKLGFVSGSTDFAAKVRGDCTLKLWEGLSHELHNEPEQAEVFSLMISWLDGHLKTGA